MKTVIRKLKTFIFVNFYKYFPVRMQKYLSRRMVLIPSEELEKAYVKAVEYLRNKGGVGDYLEFGVFRGTSMLCMNRTLNKFKLNNVRLFGFDSFEGLPSLEEQDKALTWQPGMFNTNIDETRDILENGGVDWTKTFLIKGWYNETLTQDLINKHQISNVSLIMIDCDLHSSTKEALEFSAPLIKKEAIIFFDDWDGGADLAGKNLGEKLAFDEFLQAHPEFHSEEFGAYYHTEMEGSPVSKIFLVRRT